MKRKFYIVILVLFAGVLSCEKNFDEHYGAKEETVNMKLWDVISANPDYSEFVAALTETGLDSMFQQGRSLTLFIPNNEAFASVEADSFALVTLMQFHMLDYLFNMISVVESRILQTSAGKFSLAELYNGSYQYNGSAILESSPLYLDGRYYEIGDVALPNPNLYEYIANNASVLRKYIDGFDSILLDLEESTPIGFDSLGNTVYDSVYTVVNYFDTLYYPVKEEHRSRTATFVLFNDQQYADALDEMALNLGGAMQSGEDIPKSWQDNVLMPELLSKGAFPNSLHYEDFLGGELRNIEGDYVEVDPSVIDPESRSLASNGVTFDYSSFTVPTYLYKGEIYIEGEHMVDSLGAGTFFWKPEYVVSGDQAVVSAFPSKIISEGARNDSVVVLPFPGLNYSGEFNFEFYFNDLFPQKYLLVWGANYRPSGYYQIYVNDELIREFDTFNLRSTVPSVVPGVYYAPTKNGNNMFDAWIENLTDFGDVKITIKYLAPGKYSTNGFSIDFISLTPADAF